MVHDNDDMATAYRYKWRYAPLVWVCILLPFIAAFSGWIGVKQRWADGMLVFGIGLLFVFFAVWFSLQQVADICIDDDVITRKVLGWTWQRLRWTDVNRLTIMRSTNMETGRKVRAFAFNGSKATPFFSRRIIFQERPGEMNHLLDRLETCVAKYHINVRQL